MIYGKENCSTFLVTSFDDDGMVTQISSVGLCGCKQNWNRSGPVYKLNRTGRTGNSPVERFEKSPL
jgi:hypothetical protein